MTDILAKICATKAQEIIVAKAQISLKQLEEEMAEQTAPRGFANALRQAHEEKRIGLIAEIKKASPSHGLIRADFDAAALATSYAEGGATCLSVLTDMPYFQGCADYLKAARNACTLPVLRKDFMLDTYQMAEARAWGADAVLLIMAALSNEQAKELEAAAFEYGLDVLVEVHDAQELDNALTHLKSPLMGVNNRNLKTLAIDLATSETLIKQIPAKRTPICESGIQSHSDIVRMHASGIYCFLVGESLMRQADVTNATKNLLGK